MTAPTAAAGIGIGATIGSILFPPLAPVIALAGTAAGGAVSAYGAYQGGQATQAMQNYQARVAQINAGIAKEQAGTEFAAGDIQAQRSGLETGYKMGLTRAGMAAGGLDIGAGSARGVLGSEAEIGQFDQSTIRSNAARRAYGYQVGRFGDVAQSQMDIAAGKGAVQAADVNIGTSVLGAATSVSDKWTKFSQTGLTPPPPFGQTSDNAIF